MIFSLIGLTGFGVMAIACALQLARLRPWRAAQGDLTVRNQRTPSYAPYASTDLTEAPLIEQKGHMAARFGLCHSAGKLCFTIRSLLSGRVTIWETAC